jgi:predicted  nucleic acid-binding Zn-ribbon protein
MPEELKPVNLPGKPRNIVPLDNTGPAQITGSSAYRQSRDTLESLFASVPVDTRAQQSTVFQSEVDDLLTGRYNNVIYGANNEDIHGRNQSFLDRAVNGTLKGASLAATTFVGGLGTLYGIGKSFYTGKLSDIWQNEVSESLDAINKEVDDKYLPNYYTDVEKNAAWYSPDNLLTANFLFDKLIKNTGFAIGAIYSGNLASKGIGVAGKALGGMFNKVGKYTEAWKTFSDINKGTARLFSQGKNIEAAEILRKEIKSIADVEKANAEMLKISNQFLRIEGVQDFTRKSIMSLYSSAGESTFESVGTATAFREKKIQEFRDQWGFDPGQEEMEKIDKLSREVGNASFMANMAVLSVTEFQQLPYLMGSSYKTGRAASNAFKTADDVAMEGGKYIAKPLSKTGKASRFIKSYIFDPKESLQEYLQTSIDVSVQDYYDKAYKGTEAKSLTEAFSNAGSSALSALGETLTSKEGGESILLGGISGGIMQARGKYREGQLKKKNTNSLLADLNVPENTFTNAFADRVNSLQRGIVLQQEGEKFLEEGNKSGFLDNKHDQSYNYISTRVKYGRLDMVIDDINERRNQAATNDGYKNLQGTGGAPKDISREDYLKKLNEFEKHAKDVNTLYEATNLRYQGKVDAAGNRIYSDEVIDKMVYASSKINDYDNRLMEIGNTISMSGVDTLSINESLKQSAAWQEGDLENAVREEGVVSSITKAVADINALEIPDDVKQELKNDFSDYIDVSLRRKAVLDELNDIIKSPVKYSKDEEVISVEPSKDEKKPPIVIKTKKGEKSYEVGKEYYLSRVVKKSETGEDVFEAPIFTILGDNGDGTIKIKSTSGIRDVKKSEFANYGVGSVESVQNDKKGKFFLENWNKIFIHKGLKDRNGNPRKGRLEYSEEEGVLLFKYTNDYGKERTVEVRGNQFVTQKGYKSGMIEVVGTLTAAQQQAFDDFVNEKDDIKQNIERRKQVVVDLVNNSKERLDEVNSELEKAKESLKQVEEALQNAMFTKKGLPRKNLNGYKKTINQLSVKKQAIENAIVTLQEEKDELESQLPYMESLLEYAETMPTDYKEAIEDLKSDIDSIEEMIDNTNDAIKTGGSLLSKIDSILTNALSLMDDFVKRLKEENPNIPLFIDEFKSNIERFLGEEGAKNFIAERQGFTQAVLDLQDQMSDFSDELKIPDMTNKINKLEKQIKELQSGLDDLVNQSAAKGKLLEAFEEHVAKFERELAEEKRLEEDEAFAERIMKTADPSQRTLEDSEPFEEDSKKTNTNIPRSTIASQNLPGYVASQIFGNNLESFPNRKKIKAIVVTRGNQEEALGKDIKLIEHLGQEKLSEAEMDSTIAIVMVEEQADGSRKLVGVDGKVLENPSVENMVYQVMPTEELKWSEEYGGESMFRKGTPDKVKEALRNQYKTWRTETLNNPPTGTFSIDASFGNPQRVAKTDDTGNVITKNGTPVNDENAQVSVSEAGLVTEDDLENHKVLSIPTTNDVFDRGTTFFKNVRGRVFLTLKNGLVKLQNRRFSEKEANTIYQAIARLSEIMFEEGDVKSEEAQRLLNWLKTTVYWGTPKDAQGNAKAAGHNSIFFDRVEVTDESGKKRKSLRLFFSNKDGSIPFTPSYIKDNKSGIVNLIQKLYNNVNATRVNGGKKINWAEPYEEILEVKPNGEIVARQWQNYQSYLLSSKNPDGSVRKNEELPLFTNIRPKQNTDDANRQGVYFVLTDLKYKEPKVETPPAKPAKIIPGAKVATQPTEAAKGELDLSGNKINTYTSPTGKEIKWVYDNTKSGKDAIKVLKGGDLTEVLDTLTEKLGSKEKAQDNIKGIILSSIPVGALEDEGSLSVPEEDVEYFEDADTLVEPEPEAKASEDVTVIDNEDDLDIEEQMREDEDDEPLLRKVIDQELDKYESENWTKIESWLKENFPNLPVYRVKNILKGVNGLQAWGMLKNGALYIYENAEVGTIYHEVFEGVWKLFSDPKERRAVIKEFTSRKGTFIDRPTGRVVAYKDATNSEVKEQLAEEFRDYVQYGKIPVKPVDGRPYIVRLFADIVNAIKNFFANTPGAQNNTERLFQKIGGGYYKSVIPFETNLSFAKQGIIDIEDAIIDRDSELRLKLSGETVHDVMQELTYLTLRDVIGKNEDLFNVQGKPKEELYRTLKYELGKTILKKAKAAKKLNKKDPAKYTKAKVAPIISSGIATWKNVMSQWDEIVKKHAEYLRSYNIEFDENDNANVTADENTGRGEYGSSDKIDHFRKTNSAIKLLLSTLPIMEDGDAQYSSINGRKLLPLSQVYISMMNNLHTSRNVDEMVERVRQMAINDENYRTLYRRLTGTDYTTDTFDFSDLLEKHQLQLINAIWTTFKKQNPDAQTVFIFENGDVSVGSSNLSTAARQIKREYETAISSTMRKKNPYFEYSDEKKVFVGKPGGISKVQLVSPGAQSEFLGNIGIKFTEDEIENLPTDKKVTFDNAVSGIRDSIKSADKIATMGGKVLDIEGRLLELGLVRAAINNPEFDSTFFNVKGERTQTFMGTNAVSDFFDAISQIDNLNELAGTQYEYLLTDEFTEGSVILGRMFNLKTGERKDSPAFMKAGYVDGTINNRNGKKKSSSKLNYKERLIQEINANLQGYYSNLVPADASMEHTAYMGNAVTERSLLSGFDGVLKIFKGYLESEIKLSRNPDRRIVQDKKGTRKESDLRFFKGILGEELHNKIVKDTKTPVEEIYDKYKKQIDAAVEAFIKNDAQKVKEELTEYGVISINENEEYVVQNIGFEKNEGMSEADLNRQLNALSANYIISNIELHKLIYSDPYQYEDELKRIKNFLSPRQAILYGSAKMNEAMNSVYNRNFKTTDAGYTNFNRDYFRTISYKDVLGAHDLPGYDNTAYKETDGSGIISFKSYRNFRIRASKWSDANEAQYRYDMAWEKRYKNQKLSDYEKEILADGNPEVRSTYTTEKPIVAGNKANDESFNDVVLDKYALYPLSFRVMMEINPKSNALKLYDKMQKEDIDYVIFDSGRKVGAVNSVPLYNEKGEFNTEDYSKDSIVNIPFAIMSVQTEVPSKEDEIVTRGSQVTKLATMDFMEAGVPVDFMDDSDDFEGKYAEWIKLDEKSKLEKSELYREIKNNQMLLEAMIDNGYKSLLERMGIEEVEKNGKVVDYKVTDFSKAAEILREEILKRETNDNIIDALDDFISGKAVLEATPAYQQVRNILYSIADKNVISPKITGGMKVQIPSTLLESVRAEAKTIKTQDGKTKTVYTSENLKFYKNKDGERVCEIMVGRWFKSDLTDDQLMNYFKSDEGKKILSGIGFRIPTQKQNSIDAFVVKRLLPAEFGDNVIVPAEIVNKQGSDFDIDKLSLYLKNLYTDTKGNLKLIPYFGTGAEAMSKFEDLFYEMLQEKIDVAEGGKKKISGLKEIISSIIDKTASKKTKNKWLPILRDMFGEDLTINELEEVIEQKVEAIVGRIQDLSDQNIQDKFMNRFKQTMYKKSLENAYVESLEKLVTHPKNFGQLVTPNSAEQLKGIAAEVTKLRGFETFDYSSTKNMLSRTFMSRLRHAFVSGKYAIGIAAVNQTNHSLNQRQPIYIDRDMLDNVPSEDREWLGDGKIKFGQYNSMTINGKEVPVLSMIKNKAGDFISDLIGQFIDGYVDIAKGPWIMELGAAPNVASTWLFLIKVGVPIKSVAYFMNQPIIREYLNKVENAGYSWLFIDNFVEDTLKNYDSGYKASDKIPSEDDLKDMIGDKKKLNKQQLAQQQLILKEFLKYAKMANHMFMVTQGANFDTSNFNDSFLVFKKNEQLKKAQSTIIASIDKDGKTVPAVNAILENSFIGKLAYRINSIRDAYAAEFLKSDKGRVRNVLENVLLPYVDTNDREFVKLARKAVSDLFDWAVQTDPTKKLNLAIANLLLGKNNVAEEAQEFFDSIKDSKKHPLRNNYVVQTLIHDVNGEVNNMKLKNRDNKVYDQNKIIYAFEELRNYLNSKNQLSLYKRLVAMSILQSGVSTSPIAFTQLLPYEDFKNEYNQILGKLNTVSNLESFHTLGVFQRNNWSDDDIVPYTRARWIETEKGLRYNPAMEFLPNNVKKAVKEGDIPNVLTMSALSREANSEYIVFTWEKNDELLTEKELKDLTWKQQRKVIKDRKLAMKKRADFSYINKGLFQKVKESDDVNSDPYVYMSKGDKPYFVYKMVNAWGNSFSANEFYTIGRKSVIDNNFLKVDEMSDGPILNAFIGEQTIQTKARRGSTVVKTISTAPVTADEASIKSQIAELEQKKKTKGITGVEAAQLTKLQTELGKIIKSRC